MLCRRAAGGVVSIARDLREGKYSDGHAPVGDGSFLCGATARPVKDGVRGDGGVMWIDVEAQWIDWGFRFRPLEGLRSDLPVLSAWFFRCSGGQPGREQRVVLQQVPADLLARLLIWCVECRVSDGVGVLVVVMPSVGGHSLA